MRFRGLIFLFTIGATVPAGHSAMQDFNGHELVGFPEGMASAISGFAYTAPLLDAADEKAAIVIQFPSDSTIRNIGIRTANITTGATIDARLETVNSNGEPSGTLYCANSSSTLVIASGNDNDWLESDNFVADCDVTQGSYGAIVILRQGSFNGQIATRWNEGLQGFPYTISSTSASGYVKTNIISVFSLKKSDGSYEPIFGAVPWASITSTNFNSATNPNRRGLRFRLKESVRVVGAWVWTHAAAEQRLELYDKDGATLLTSVIIATNTTADTSSTQMNYFYFSTSVVLNANTYYRLVQAATNTNNAIAWVLGVTTPSDMSTLTYGDDFHLTTAQDPTAESSWTNTTTTSRPLIGPIINAIDINSGQGGYGISH